MSENKPDLMAELAEVAQALDQSLRVLGEVVGEDEAQAMRLSCAELSCETALFKLRTRHAELEAVVRKAARYDYLSGRVYVEDHDGGWSSSYKLLPIPRHDGSTYKDAKPYNFVTLDDAIDHAMHNSAREG